MSKSSVYLSVLFYMSNSFICLTGVELSHQKLWFAVVISKSAMKF